MIHSQLASRYLCAVLRAGASIGVAFLNVPLIARDAIKEVQVRQRAIA